MRAAHLLVGLLAMAAAALVAIALLGGGRAEGVDSTQRPDRVALRPTGLPRPTAPRVASSALAVMRPAPPEGIPVVGADPNGAAAPVAVPDPISVADPVAVPDPIAVPDPVAVANPTGVAPQATAPAPAGATGALADGWGPRPAPDLDPRPFAEAHWQGLEAIPRTQALIESLKLPPDVEGVILDDVTLPADLEGFRAGDLVTAVNGTPTPNLMRLVEAADKVREDKRVTLDVVRAGAAQRLELVALFDRLGTANAETPAMIPPGARSPHPYQGPCLSCHRIGTTGSLAADQGDPLPGPPPPIRAGATRPHRDRGLCTSCHRILP